MADRSATLAVDLGGTQMRAAVVTLDGGLRLRRSEPTPHAAACPDALMDLVGDVLADHPVARAVTDVPGRVDPRRGRLKHAPNLPPPWPDALVEPSLAERNPSTPPPGVPRGGPSTASWRWTLWRTEKHRRLTDDRGAGVSSAAVFDALNRVCPVDAVLCQRSLTIGTASALNSMDTPHRCSDRTGILPDPRLGGGRKTGSDMQTTRMRREAGAA